MTVPLRGVPPWDRVPAAQQLELAARLLWAPGLTPMPLGRPLEGIETIATMRLRVNATLGATKA